MTHYILGLDRCDRRKCDRQLDPEVMARCVFTGEVGANGMHVVKLFCSNRCYTIWILDDTP